MSNVVGVTLVNSQSDDPVLPLTLPKGTTIQKLLDLNNVNTGNMVVTVKLDGEEIDYDLEDEVEDGMRVTVVPERVKGA